MTSSYLYNCVDCGRQFNAAVLDKCPKCGLQHFQNQTELRRILKQADPIVAGIPNTRLGTRNTADNSQSNTPAMSNYGRVAASSAEVVNAYGTWIQVAGGILGILVFLGVWYTFIQQYEGEKGFLIGLIIGIYIFLSNLVFGALYRMISNYVLFKVRG